MSDWFQEGNLSAVSSLPHPFDSACPPSASSDACPHLSLPLHVYSSSNMQRRNKNCTCSWGEFAFAYFHYVSCRSTELWHPFIQLNVLISQKVNASCRQCLCLICPYLIVFFNSKHIYGNELAWLCTSLWPFSLQAMQCWCEMSQKHKFPLQRFLVEGMEASSPTPVSPMEQPHLHCPYLDHRPGYGSHISTGNQAGNKIWNHGSNTNN